MRSKYEIYIPVVSWLHSQKRTDHEIAECIGIDARRVSDLRNKIGLSKNNLSEIPIVLSEVQKQILIGGIIGDMCIFKDKNSTYHRMNLAHSTKQKNYLLLKANLLGDLFYKPKERSWVDSRTDNEYHEIRIQSKTHSIFSELYNKWYQDGKKIIHDDIWQINELGLAIAYFDDGCKSSTGFSISMDDYSANDINKFASVLREKFNLDCTVPNLNRSVYIKTESSERFREMIRPLITIGTEYKL